MVVTVIVRMLTGKKIPVKVCDTERELDDIIVVQLKDKISAVEGSPASLQELIFAGQVLEDYRPLSDYGIKHMSVVHMTLDLRGGGPRTESEEESLEEVSSEEVSSEEESSEEESSEEGDGRIGDKKGKNRSMEKLCDF